MDDDNQDLHDIPNLTDHQQQVLANFQEITQIHDDILSIQILQQNAWDLDRSVNSFMGGAEVDENNSEEDEPLTFPPQGSNYQQHFTPAPYSVPSSAQSFASNSGAATRRAVNSAEQISSAQPAAPAQGSLLDLLFVPLRWLFQARPTSLNPAQDAESFIADFRSNYGPVVPDFHSGSYQSAVATAHNQSRFLLVYLHSPLHEDTDRFCTEFLLARSFLDFAHEHLVLWGGRVWDAEAYGLSHQLGAASFPFLGLLLPQTGRVVQIADRIQGYPEQETRRVEVLLQRLQQCVSVFSVQLRQQREENRRREEATRLREEQNREYEESVAAERRAREERERAEREKADRERAEREAAAAREAQARSAEEARQQSLQRLRAQFAQDGEPKTGDKDVATLRFQLPRGKKVTRNFLRTERVQKLFDYLTLQFYDDGDVTKNFSVFIPHPRTEISDREATIESVGLYPRGMLYVQDMDT